MKPQTIHPRMLVRAVNNLRSKRSRLAAERITAIGALEEAIAGLRRLEQAPDCGFASTLIQEYEAALIQLKALDPKVPPNPELLRAIGARLELFSNFLCLESQARLESRKSVG